MTTPKLPPPPRIAQKSSGWDVVADVDDLACRRDDFGAEKAIDGEPVLSREISNTSAERDAADADRARVPESRRHAVGANAGGVLACRQSGPRPGAPPICVDVERFQIAQIQNDAALGRAVASAAVAAAPDGERQTGLARKLDDLHHVRGICRPDDDRRMAVEASTEDRYALRRSQHPRAR